MQIFNKKSPEEKRKELILDIERKNMLKHLLETEAWKKVIEPYIDEKIEELKNGMIWQGQTRTADEIAIGTAFNSGAILTLKDIKRKINLWIEIGIKAEEKLNKINGG